MKNKLVHRFIIGTFVSLYLLVSVISTIHVIDFFKLSNPYWLSVSLAIAFELGAAASLASLIILEKMNKGLVWTLFITITLMQMQGNMYYAFVNMEDFQGWSELFGLIEEDLIYQKRVLAAVSGAILPLVALGFIKSLVDYIKPEENKTSLSEENLPSEKTSNTVPEEQKIEDVFEDSPESQILENKDTEESLSSNEDEIKSPTLSEEEVSSIIDNSSAEENPESSTVPGYYGNIEVKERGIITEENQILPVNSNKREKIQPIDNSSKVEISPMRL